MGKNSNLNAAKEAKNDEFYTQYADIEKEIMAYVKHDKNVFKDKIILLPCDDPEQSNFTRFFVNNFDVFGIKKLISTCFAQGSRKYDFNWQPDLFEQVNPLDFATKNDICGKVFIMENNKGVDVNKLDWHYLEGTGDFKSKEVTNFRNEADFVITNPPFSLFRDFFDWVIEASKKFAVIGNMNSVIYRNVFPQIKEDMVWIGTKGMCYEMTFKKNNGECQTFGNVCWFTNIEYNRHKKPLKLKTMDKNLQSSRHTKIIENGYPKYDNYDAIEVPFTDAIPSDYEGIMGVPISFINKFCREQFEIISFGFGSNGDDLRINGETPYARILIKKK